MSGRKKNIGMACGHAKKDNMPCGLTQKDDMPCGQTETDNIVGGQTKKDIVTRGQTDKNNMACGESKKDRIACGQTQKSLAYLSALDKDEHDITLDGKSLTIPQLYAVCKNLKLGDIGISENEMQENFSYMMNKLSEGTIIYDVNTGFGGSANVRPRDMQDLQISLIRHLNVGFGDTLPWFIVRGVMLVRANSLCKAYSGVRPIVPQTLLEMIKKGVTPQAPKRGSISASGDLVPTSYIAAVMMGEPDTKARYQGKILNAPEAMKEAGLTPIIFEAKEALALINSSSFAATLASCVLFDTNVAVLLTQLSAAMSTEALMGRLETFSPILHECMPHDGQREVAANLRSILRGSKMVKAQLEVETNDDGNSLKQDRYSIRSIPQWLGPVLEITAAADKRTIVEINSANDNPLIDHRTGQIIHGANFQGIHSTISMDQTRQAIQMCGKIMFAQLSEIVNVQLNYGLPPNLSGSDYTTDFGFKGVEIAMASYMSELDYLTNVLTNHVISAEMCNQSVNSLALISARYTEQALEILNMMLASIICVQLQAIDLRWLQPTAIQKLTELCQTHQVRFTSTIQQAFPWYAFLFRPSQTICELKNEFAKDDVDWIAFQKVVEYEMNELSTKLGTDDTFDAIASHLGKGKCEHHN